MAELQEVLRKQRITAVPRSPKYLKGITSIRGKILPIVCLRERLGLKGEDADNEKIIVLSGKREPLGVLVDAVVGVFRFPSRELSRPPSTLTVEEKDFIEGVVKIHGKFTSVLKVDEMLKIETS
ncbi:MAG: chemotaxis protein CheW [Candidatus Mariimomonas ferrooxydans]